QATTFRISEPEPYLGSALEVDLLPNTGSVAIFYRTSPDGAAALDWLEPGQTAGKQQPFLFTQGQAILTRSWIPCQDSPGIRITYDATVTVPAELLAVMSATNPQQKNDTGVYRFRMEQPIPPYLLALAVGDLAFAPIGERTGVYAEPSVVEDAAYEFDDMGKMLQAAEDLYGPYQWGRYDVIVLPPSFPFGGMENPRLTFATPTIIAGDRSLTTLIAHELAHSWSGNLVTNATWNDFWLNEGFTVYFERRIMEKLYGRDYADMLAIIGYHDLVDDVNDLGPDSPDTQLYLDLAGRDPDDGMTDVAYEKGAFFLQLLEEKAGREAFDAFLKKYFTEHRFETMTTKEFVVYLRENLLEPNQIEVDIDEWIYGPGIPSNMPAVNSTRFDRAEAAAESVAEGGAATAIDTTGWSAHEWLHFVRHLPRDLSLEQAGSVDQAFDLTHTGNSEVKAAWLELSIRNGYSRQIEPALQEFLVRVGRRKFLSPLYRALVETDQRELGRRIYELARPNYHSVSRKSIEAILKV
ncbi:MAG: M1 family metallopeptidase, partial [Saprospiraceae bacterium]|nr:M1 family metallopeptidase [Saprospiraceae bacterium]